MRFAANAVRLQLHALTYNLANFLRTLATPDVIGAWSFFAPRLTLPEQHRPAPRSHHNRRRQGTRLGDQYLSDERLSASHMSSYDGLTMT